VRFLISPPASATTTAAKVPFLRRPCLVDSQTASTDFFAIELRDCFLGSGVVRNLHEAETFRASGIAIRDDLNRFNVADFAEHVTQISFRGLKREISNVDFFCHRISICGFDAELGQDVRWVDYFRSSRGSRRTFLRLRFRANACLMRFFSPGFK
jgi:hypothetical protein